MSDFSLDIAGQTLEYIEAEHLYIVNGIVVPSITQILAVRYGKKYQNINEQVLKKAAENGTAVHKAIEDFCKTGAESDLIELRNFKFLRKHYNFEIIGNEVPVILFDGASPIGAGRLDLVLKMDGAVGGADIKRTSTLDKNYLTCQLNLYRRAYAQSYGIEWDFLKGIHLRDDIRKIVNIPINEQIVDEILCEYERKKT